MTRQRFYINNLGEKFEPIKEALEIANNFVSENFPISHVYLVLPSAEYMGNLVSINLIEKDNISQLEFDSLTCEIISFNKISKTFTLQDAIIISTWLNCETLFKIEQITGVKGIIAIPYTNNSLELWIQTFGPFDVLNNKTMEFITISNPKLKSSFDALTKERINWSNLSLDDERTIKQLIKAHQTRITPIEIFAYLRREKNLSYNRCIKFRDWTNDLLNGKNVRI